MNEVNHFCSQHVTHVKYRRYLCEKLRYDVIMDKKVVKYSQSSLVFSTLKMGYIPEMSGVFVVLFLFFQNHF